MLPLNYCNIETLLKKAEEETERWNWTIGNVGEDSCPRCSILSGLGKAKNQNNSPEWGNLEKVHFEVYMTKEMQITILYFSYWFSNLKT